jgi:hypothetical protein
VSNYLGSRAEAQQRERARREEQRQAGTAATPRGARPMRGLGRPSSTKEHAIMSDLVAIAYDDLDTARRMANDLGDAVKARDIELGDLLIVERSGDGKLKLQALQLALDSARS